MPSSFATRRIVMARYPSDSISRRASSMAFSLMFSSNFGVLTPFYERVHKKYRNEWEKSQGGEEREQNTLLRAVLMKAALMRAVLMKAALMRVISGLLRAENWFPFVDQWDFRFWKAIWHRSRITDNCFPGIFVTLSSLLSKRIQSQKKYYLTGMHISR